MKTPPAVQPKRLMLAQITVCQGCCCGKTEKGHPEVPVEWLKKEWKLRGLLKRVHLTITGCLGPCDVPNVVAITSFEGPLNTPLPLFTALVRLLQKIAPLPAILSNTSGAWPGSAIRTRHVLAAEPLAKVSVSCVPRLPV